MKIALRSLVFLLLALCSWQSIAQQVPITRYARFTGNVNFVATGGSLRTQSDNGNSCVVGGTSSQALSGIPAGSSIVAAYLYWGGSGSNIDTNVTLNGSGVTAQRTFQSTFFTDGTSFPFFGAFADVTNRVNGNATFTFGGLGVATGNPHCNSSAVLAGWGLIVVYGSASERLRAINIFDGLQFFRGNSLTLTPDGFRIPTSNVDGRMAIVAWEGDPGNSEPMSGSAESLSFNGSVLNDGINVAGSDPTAQPFDGTVNSQGANNTYGVDVDTFNVSSLLNAGQTSATTEFSAGGDLVLLTAQIVSVTSEPVVDLSIATSHTGNFSVGTNGTYSITVSNQPGSQPTDFPIVVTDTLPTGLTFVSGSGTGWSCSASGQTVSCTHAGPLAASSSLPTLSIVVAVGNAAAPAVTHQVQVTTPSHDPDSSNNAASDPTTVIGPNLSTSTKMVQDLNGGDAVPGDTLRYTITLIETGGIAATGITVTDDVPANVSGFVASGINIPAGAVNNSTYNGTGANDTGLLNISGISVPANSSAIVTFDVQVAAEITPGATIDNTANIQNPAGLGATPSSPQIIVSQSQIPGAGTKPLYLWSEPSRVLSRTPPSGSHDSVNINGGGSSATWVMTPSLQTPLTLQAGSFAVRLWLTRSGAGGLFQTSRQVSVALVNSSLGTLASTSSSVSLSTLSPTQSVFTLTLPNSVTVPVGSTFSLVVRNTTSQSNRDINVFPTSGGDVSRVELQSATVINVDSVQTFDAPYPAGTATASFTRGRTAYVRAIVSDPFGSFDISGSNITIVDPASNVVTDNVDMAQVADSGNATRTYEFAFAVPSEAPLGAWTPKVTAREGTEDTVSDLGVGAFSVVMPNLQIQKLSEVVSDPHNGVSNPKRIPGSVVRYSIVVTNTGAGMIDPSSLALASPMPPRVSVYAATTSGNPVEFVDGTTSSGLTFSYASDVLFSNTPGGGPPYTYIPAPDPNGFDPAITGLLITPSGSMNGAAGANTPSFTVRFLVRVE